ncbi:MAG: hypothetical protein K6A81_01555 [Clostridiales bacterium]|nr:hypothetical protein [Clostridiales bacterium]
MKRALKTILSILLVIILVIIGFAIYGAVNYTKRCVKVTPKDDISVIELNKTYSIEDFFTIEREKSPDGRTIDIHWENGSKDNIVIDKDGNFTVTEGSGKLTIRLSDRNPNSPEAADGSVTVTVEG